MTDYELNIRLAFMVGIFLISAILFLLFYLSWRRKPSLLWLSLYCFSHPIKSLFKPYQNLLPADFILPYQTHAVSQAIVVLGGFCLIGFILWELDLKKRKLWILCYGLFCILSYFVLSDRLYSDSLIVLGIGLSIYGVVLGRKGAWWMLVGMAGYTTLNYLGHADILGFAYFMGIIFFIICMLASTGRNIADEMRKQQEAVLRATTLENQLLKTTIQPHFVFNSLTALQELIEQDSEKASDFVEKIAMEFQLITKVSSKNLIPLEEEIKLCNIHLRIMEYRKGGQFRLEVDGITGDEKIPPGIFHSLVENGISHGYSTKKEGYFKLSKVKNQEVTTYSLFNDSQIEEHTVKEGTGIRYVKAALAEHFGSQATMTYGFVNGGWEVKIIVKE